MNDIADPSHPLNPSNPANPINATYANAHLPLWMLIPIGIILIGFIFIVVRAMRNPDKTF
jgi:hypothetical protein